MRTKCIQLTCLCISLCLLAATPPNAEAGSLSAIIEGFVQKQFPGASSHLWVVNGAQWQAKDELVLDVNAYVTRQLGQPPSVDRFLLLIIEDKVAATQSIPVDATTDCQPEQT